MLYIFGFFSLLSPAIFLQSRVLDSPLVPIIGTQQKCLGRVCLVYPSPGTNLFEFMDMVPPLGLPTIGPGRSMMERDDENGGYGGRGEHRELQGRVYASPFFVVRQSPPSVELLSSSMFRPTGHFHENDIGVSGLCPRPVYVTCVTKHPSSSIPRPLAQSHCLKSNKAWHIRNETCPYTVSGNDADGLPVTLPSTATMVESHPFIQPRCRWSEKALHLLNGTSSILSTLPSANVVIKSRPVPRLRCLTTDKALHLVNDTCLLDSSVDTSSKQVVEAILPSSGAIHYQRTSTFSLPCLSSSQARPIGPRNCGFETTPDLAMARNWDIRSQATLLSSKPVERTPAFLTIPVKSEPPMCHRRRDRDLVSGVCIITAGFQPIALPVPTTARAPVASKRLSLVGSPRLRSITMDCIIACLLIVLGIVLPAGAGPARCPHADLTVEEPFVGKVRVKMVHFDVSFKGDVPSQTIVREITPPPNNSTKCRQVAGVRTPVRRSPRLASMRGLTPTLGKDRNLYKAKWPRS